MVPGTMISDWAKMMGITPDELMRSGMNVFCPSRIRPRPMTLRGIWIGIRRAATVTATVPATTSTMMPSTMKRTGTVSERARNASRVRSVSGQMRSTIEKKIKRLAPLPMPRSVHRARHHGARRGGDGRGDGGGAPYSDPDSPQGHGTGTDPRGAKDVHPAAHQLVGRDAHHLRPIADHRAGHHRHLQR